VTVAIDSKVSVHVDVAQAPGPQQRARRDVLGEQTRRRAVAACLMQNCSQPGNRGWDDKGVGPAMLARDRCARAGGGAGAGQVVRLGMNGRSLPACGVPYRALIRPAAPVELRRLHRYQFESVSCILEAEQHVLFIFPFSSSPLSPFPPYR
jgi:hypothetical protein